MLTNAIYFKAAWLRPFPLKQTKDAEFFGDGKTNKVPMMQNQLRTGYAKFGDLHVLELPYQDDELSMRARRYLRDLRNSATIEGR